MTREIPLGSMQDVVAVVIAQNPLLRAEMEAMLFDLVRDMRDVIRSRHRAHILPLQKAILPGLLRGLQNGQNANQEQQEREAYDRMLSYLGGDVRLDAIPTG